jgi:hypothetical protein
MSYRDFGDPPFKKKQKRALESALECLGPTAKALHIRAANMRQLLGAAFYLFGFIFCWTLPWVMVTMEDSRIPGGILVMRHFFIDIAFAANVFSVLLVPENPAHRLLVQTRSETTHL